MLDGDDRGRRGVGPPDRVGAGADRGGQRDLVDVPGAGAGGRAVADDEDERHLGLHRLGQRRERVGEAGAVGRGRRGDPPAGTLVGVRRHDSPGLVADRGELHVARALEGVEDVRVAVAHDPEDVVDVAGQGVGDVGGDAGHTSFLCWRHDGIEVVCVSRAGRGSVLLFRAPARSGTGPLDYRCWRGAGRQDRSVSSPPEPMKRAASASDPRASSATSAPTRTKEAPCSR